MLNDCDLQRHQNWISAISASFDTVFDPCWQHVGHVGISIDHSRAFFTHAPTCWSLYILCSLHQEDHRCTSLAVLELMTNDAYLSLG